MMTGITYRQYIRASYILGLSVMIAFLPHSKIMLSLAQFWLALTFALDRYNTRRWQELFRSNPVWKSIILAIPLSVYLLFSSILKGFRAFVNNRPALIFSSILLLHIAGLLFTTDFTYAFKDIRTKGPLLFLPLFMATSPSFSRRYFYWFMILFVATVLVRTLMNSWNLVGGHYVDIRDISRSISHVLVALNITLAFFVLVCFIFRRTIFPAGLKVVFILIGAWFLAFHIFAHSDTGILVTGITFLVMGIIYLVRSRKLWLKVTLFTLLIVSVVFSAFYISRMVKDYYKVNEVEYSKLDKFTALGHPYIHNLVNRETENGNYLYIYIQWQELEEAWNKRSSIPATGRDKKNQQISYTLVRYLSSKGLRKDAEGMSKLTDADIHAIENGTANVIYTWNFSIRGQVYILIRGIDEYRKRGNPTGSSLMQRVEFWRASLGIIRDNWLTGVGTGDMNEAFQQQYDKMNSKLAPSQRWRSHNQFLSIFVGFGVIGFLWFLFAILYPPIVLGKFKDYFFLVFFIIAMLSMIPEDTIESQLGVTFFAFFYSFFLFARKEDDNIQVSNVP